MMNTPYRGFDNGEPHDDQYEPRPEGRRHRHHHGGGRPGRSGRRPDLRALLSDRPVGTTPEALAEAFLGVGRLLRAQSRFTRRGPRNQGELTFARAALLATLDTDGPQRMGELAHRLGVVPRTVTPMVDALEDENLLTRETDPDDRRATLLRITPAGSAELTRTRTERRTAVDEIFAALGDDERSALAAVLDKLLAAARAGLDPATLHGAQDRDGDRDGPPARG